jgi:hypothetical protein
VRRPCDKDLASPLEPAAPAQELSERIRRSSGIRDRSEKFQHRLALTEFDAGPLTRKTPHASGELLVLSGFRSASSRVSSSASIRPMTWISIAAESASVTLPRSSA